MYPTCAQDKSLWRALVLAGILAGLVMGVPVGAWAQTYTFTTIDVPGAFYTQLWGINNAGQIALWLPLRTHNVIVRADPVNTDADGDGVADSADACPNTVVPETVPSVGLLPDHYALTDGNKRFDTASGTVTGLAGLDMKTPFSHFVRLKARGQTSPPATAIACPVIAPAPAPHNQSTASATSCGLTRRPCGLCFASSAAAS